jgi:hypothetical protein
MIGALERAIYLLPHTVDFSNDPLLNYCRAAATVHIGLTGCLRTRSI